MNIVITGSLGHISKPLTQQLVQKKQAVTVISSKSERKAEIEHIGAQAAIGSVEDVRFLTETFKNADVVYCMEPPVDFSDQQVDMPAYYRKIGQAYVQAIRQSGVNRIIHLSSIGAHTDQGVGMLKFHHEVENIFRELPANVSIRFMRPVGFYTNLFAQIPAIKTQEAIVSNYGGDMQEPWVAPADIAEAIYEEIITPFEGRKVRYVASDELSPNKIASILGSAIGLPELKWIVISDQQFLEILVATGMNPDIAKGFIEMNAGRQGKLYDDYYRNRPILSKTKMKDFAQEFALAFQNSH